MTLEWAFYICRGRVHHVKPPVSTVAKKVATKGCLQHLKGKGEQRDSQSVTLPPEASKSSTLDL